MTRGIVIGKFYPPHLGHNYLIDTALKNCDEVTVLVCDSPAYALASSDRAEWLQAHHPKANVRIIPDISDDDNSPAWALHTLRFLGYKPDVVFSSETYGKPWAEAMGCRYVNVDIARNVVPISGTKVRQDILESWDYLSDETKAGLAIRIVVIGAESTGTTTLSHNLAEKLQVPWVPEVGRYYTESLITDASSTHHDGFSEADWQARDFHAIGKLQQHYENTFAARSRGVIVCDTNATATEVWQRRYVGKATAEMKQIAAKDKVDLYIVTGDEIPFVQDGGRDGEHMRHTMHRWFVKRAKQSGVPYITVTGDYPERLASATAKAKEIITLHKIIQ